MRQTPVAQKIGRSPQIAAPSSIPINDFGAFLRFLRERAQLTQRELVSAFTDYYDDYGVPGYPLTADMYRKLEKGRRAPQFEELQFLLATFIGACRISMQDIQTCLRLARLKIAGLQRRQHTPRDDGEWRLLEMKLQEIHREHATSNAPHLQAVVREARPRFSFDTSHLQGREAWLDEMLAYLDGQPKKIVVVKGMMGVGKTSGLKLLLQRILRRDNCYPLFYAFPTADTMTPADHLQAFLGTVLAELHVADPEASKALPLETQIKQVLDRLAEVGHRVILLVDDGQVILDAAGQLSPEWEMFLRAFVGDNHQALMYWATREWPLWSGRDRSLIVAEESSLLPSLSVETCIAIWKRLGVTEVSDHLLAQASERCGYNPLMIELRASSLLRPRLAFSWHQSSDISTRSATSTSTQQRLLEELLQESQVFGALDVDVRKMLQQVVGHRLTQGALLLLEVLAASPLALPLPLLNKVAEDAEYTLVELLNASLLDRNALSDGRARLLPLAREAGIQRLQLAKRLQAAETQLITLYQDWLSAGMFLNEQEQASFVSELAILLLKHRRLFDTAGLLIQHGWLSLAFGHASRLARIADDVLKSFNWRQAAEDEFGGLLLHHYLLVRFLEKNLAAPERKKAYLHLFDLMNSGTVRFNHHLLVHLAVHKLRYLTLDKQYQEASLLIDELCHRYRDLQKTDPVIYTELLDRRAFVLGRWGDFQDAQSKKESNPEEIERLQRDAFRLRREAVLVHQECIVILREQEYYLSPIGQSRARFKRARLLNDLSYYQRTTGLLEEAKASMMDCLELKEAGYVVPGSIAVSYDDYGQLLGQLGHFREALSYSDSALKAIQEQINAGNTLAVRERGMMLINRGKLLTLLGRLDEAESLFLEGIARVEGTSREVSAVAARKELELIAEWRRENPRQQLDWRWFPEYHRLASYSDVALLAQAGPFIEAEKQEWALLWPRREENEVSKRLAAIVNQSRRRELASCLEEQRSPQFHYPFVPHDEILARIESFERLRADVTRQERNVIVRHLYQEAIDERLDELNMIAAASEQNEGKFWHYNQRLNGLPTLPELEFALRHLSGLLQLGLGREETRDICSQIIRQSQPWDLSPISLVPLFCEQGESGQSDSPETFLPPEAIERFFANVFRQYQFSWSIEYDSITDHARVSLTNRRLILPNGRPMTLTKVRELLGHEIEIHAFRASSGERSSLALLSTGLQGSLDVEEGLATFYTEDAAQISSSWIGTLATGLATGLICPPFTFHELRTFFEKVNLLKSLLARKAGTMEALQEDARKRAQNRCLRTWRGISQFSQPGICSTKDSVYLRGYLSVTQALAEGKATFDQLMVGSVGLHHLTDLAELGIVEPAVQHRRLSANPELEKYILQFADKA